MDNKNHTPDQDILETGRSLRTHVKKTRQAAFARFPLLFTLLTAFGLVATFYGFENIIDRIPFLKENPIILLSTGVAILIGTGTLYKKLQ